MFDRIAVENHDSKSHSLLTHTNTHSQSRNLQFHQTGQSGTTGCDLGVTIRGAEVTIPVWKCFLLADAFNPASTKTKTAFRSMLQTRDRKTA